VRRSRSRALNASQRALAAALRGTQYRTLEGQTHDVSAKVLAPVLSEFFRGQARVPVA
jgi:hypothetical protein